MKQPEILAKLSLEQNVPCYRVEINSIEGTSPQVCRIFMRSILWACLLLSTHD